MMQFILPLILFVSVQASDIFVSFAVLPSYGVQKVEQWSQAPNQFNYQCSEGHRLSVSFALGYREQFDEDLYLEPTISHRISMADIYKHTAYAIELPLAYKFELFDQKFTLGPALKTLYHWNISSADTRIMAFSGSRLNYGVGFNFIIENEYLDFFIMHEHLFNKVEFYDTNENSTHGEIGLDGHYLGYGIRLRF